MQCLTRAYGGTLTNSQRTVLKFSFNRIILDILLRSRLPSEKPGKPVGARIITISSFAQAQMMSMKDPVPSSGGKRKRVAFVSKEDVNREFTGMGLGPWRRYCHSKLCNNLFVWELNELLKKECVFCNAATPGAVNTGMWCLSHFFLRPKKLYNE